MPKRIVITGGTGLLGSKLRQALEARGDEVRILTTSAVRANQQDAYYWNLKDQYIDNLVFEKADAIIHLAGAGVADKRWTERRKKEIYDSRIRNTRLLHDRAMDHGIESIISASAIGYYGMDSGPEWVNEDSNRGEGFLADVVVDWEKAVMAMQDDFLHVAALRIGIVLSTEGGALPKMMTPFKFGVGSPIGTGDQFMSWIHIDDLTNLFLHVLDNQLSGVYNAVAPHPVTNKEFSKQIADTLEKPFFMPNVPSFVLKLLFGELAGVLLGGNKVHAGKMEKTGFTFSYPQLDSALQDLLVN